MSHLWWLNYPSSPHLTLCVVGDPPCHLNVLHLQEETMIPCSAPRLQDDSSAARLASALTVTELASNRLWQEAVSTHLQQTHTTRSCGYHRVKRRLKVYGHLWNKRTLVLSLTHVQTSLSWGELTSLGCRITCTRTRTTRVLGVSGQGLTSTSAAPAQPRAEAVITQQV